MRLTREQVNAFHRDGYLIVDGYLGDDEVAHLQDCYVSTIARLRDEQVLQNVQSGDDSDDDAQVYQIRTAHLQHPVFRMIINDSRLLDIVECMPDPPMLAILPEGATPVLRGEAAGGDVQSAD